MDRMASEDFDYGPSAEQEETYARTGMLLGYEGQELRDYVKERVDNAINRYERQLARRDAWNREYSNSAQTNNGQNTERPVGLERIKSELPILRNGDDIETFFTNFDNFLRLNEVQEKDKKLYFERAIQSHARVTRIYQEAPDDEKYDEIKEDILQRFSLTMEDYRKKYRNEHVSFDNAKELWNKLSYWERKWLQAAGADEVRNVRDLYLKEQYLKVVSPALRVKLLEIDFYTKPIKEGLDIAQGFLNGLRDRFGNKTNWQNRPMNRETQSGRWHKQFEEYKDNVVKCYACGKFGHYKNECRENKGRGTPIDGVRPKSELKCFKCGLKGHFSTECRSKNWREHPDNREKGKHAYSAKHRTDIHDSSRKAVRKLNTNNLEVDQEVHDPKSAEFPEEMGMLCERKVKVLRDTGCNVIMVRTDIVPKDCLRNEFTNIVVANGNELRAQKAIVWLRTSYFSQITKVWCVKNLAWDVVFGNVKGISKQMDTGVKQQGVSVCQENEGTVEKNRNILSTEGSGEVTPEVRIEETASRVNETEEVYPEQEDRIKNEGTEEANSTEVNVEEEIEFEKSGEVISSEEMTESQKNNCLVVTRAQSQREKLSPVAIKVKHLPKWENIEINTETLIKMQREDESLEQCWINAGKNGYAVKDGVLVRSYDREDLMQVVLPKPLRETVMSMAHESLLSGHMGKARTTKRITAHFYWPRCTSDIKNFVRSCDICQKMTKTGRNRAPLIPVPVVGVPFQKVAIDLIGPLIPSARKHVYILTIVDYASKYPEAMPLKKGNAIEVAEALLNVFSRVGFPKEIVHDQGSNFMSNTMQELFRLSGMRSINTTVYHAMSNGSVERMNATLESMLRKLIDEEAKDWDRLLQPLLFAYREAPNESTGFSPFELIFAHSVRGPLYLLKNKWVPEKHNLDTDVFTHVMNMREKVRECLKIAGKNQEKAKAKQKRLYDRGCHMNNIHVGDRVLLLLPTSTNKLFAAWKGPFTVVSRRNAVDYIVRHDDGKEKTYHINMLKKYYVREEQVEEKKKSEDIKVANVAMEVKNEEEELDILHYDYREGGSNIKDVQLGTSLGKRDQERFGELIQRYESVFSDKPGLTNLTEHEIELIDDMPVYSQAYNIPIALRTKVEEELKEMINEGIIRKSHSSWASPVVVIPKDDGSVRICLDMRKVNQKVKCDPFPMPRIEEILQKVGGSKYLTRVDLSKGFWQIPVKEDHRKYTAFVVNGKHYECNRVP